MYSIKALLIMVVASILVTGCGGGSSSSGGGDAAGGVTSDMRGTWNGNLGSTTYVMNITQATGGPNAGTVRFANGNGGPISLEKEGNDLTIVIDFPTVDCIGRFFGGLTSENTARGNYRETGTLEGCGFSGEWSMRR